jgi:hypothetical protein
MEYPNQTPYKIESDIISPLMKRNIILLGIYQLIVLILNIFFIP